MVTASHNPKEYNGYKAYGPDGAQMSPEDSKIVIDTIENLSEIRQNIGTLSAQKEAVEERISELFAAAEKLRAEPELAATAEALIANDMNVILTAEKMYVHRNTVTLRAARLRELLGIDPLHKDADKFLLMLVCAYIRRYC